MAPTIGPYFVTVDSENVPDEASAEDDDDAVDDDNSEGDFDVGEVLEG